MKNLICLFLVGSLAFVSCAQDTFEEGKLVTKQTMKSDNEQVNAQLKMVGDVESVSYIKGDKSRTEVSSAMTGVVTTIVDADSKKMLILMDNPQMGKIYSSQDITLSEEDKNSIEVKKGEETKTILGYDCQQYFATVTKQGQAVNMEMLVTDAIKAPSQQTAEFGDKIKGFPLYVKIDMSQMGAEMTVISEVTEIVKESVSADMFDLTPPEGYEAMPE